MADEAAQVGPAEAGAADQSEGGGDGAAPAPAAAAVPATEAPAPPSSPLVRPPSPVADASQRLTGSIVGVDVGTLGSRTAIVDPEASSRPTVVRNRLSVGETFSCVSLIPNRMRVVGDVAVDSMHTQPLSVIHSFTRLLAHDPMDFVWENTARLLRFRIDPETAGALVPGMGADGSEKLFLPQQLIAVMLVNSLHCVRCHMSDVVRAPQPPSTVFPSILALTVPPCSSAAVRGAMLEAAVIAGMPAEGVRVYDAAAAALVAYRVTHYGDLPAADGEPARVVICSVGHAYAFIVLGYVTKNTVEVKACCCGPWGFSAVDAAISAKVDVLENPKGATRLDAESRKAKEILSTISRTVMVKQPLLGEIDLNRGISKDEMISLSSGYLGQIRGLCVQFKERVAEVLGQAWSPSLAGRMEGIGGGLRSPMVQEVFAEELGQALGSTLDGAHCLSNGQVQGDMCPVPSVRSEIQLPPSCAAMWAACERGYTPPEVAARVIVHSHARAGREQATSAAVAKSEARLDYEKQTAEFLQMTVVVESPETESRLSSEQLADLQAQEVAMQDEDARWAAIGERRNAIEAHVFFVRDMRECVPEDQRAALSAVLEEAEEWLECAPEDTPVEELDGRLEQLKGRVDQEFPAIPAEVVRRKEERERRDKEMSAAAAQARAEDAHRERSDAHLLASAEKRRDQGNTLFRQEHWDDAATRYTQALSLLGSMKEPTVQMRNKKEELALSSHLNLSSCCVHLRHWRKAVDHADRALELDPGRAKAHYRKGQALLREKDFTAARKALKKAQSLAPGDQAIARELEMLRKEEDQHTSRAKRVFSRLFS